MLRMLKALRLLNNNLLLIWKDKNAKKTAEKQAVFDEAGRKSDQAGCKNDNLCAVFML